MTILSFKTDTFEGPLDLLLSLIKKHKLDIYDISVFEIVKQYIAFIDKAKDHDLELTSEFLEMAARLVHMKSVMLLPRHEEEGQELKKELEGELLEYSSVKEVARELKNRYIGNEIFVRQQMEFQFDHTYSLNHPPNVLLQALLDAMGKKQRLLPQKNQHLRGL